MGKKNICYYLFDFSKNCTARWIGALYTTKFNIKNDDSIVS